MRCIIKTVVCGLMLFCFHLNSFSQNIDLSLNRKTVKDAIEILTKKYGYSFVFESGDVNTQKIISIEVQQQTIDAVIKQILQDQNLSYEIKDKNIVVRSKESEKGLSAVSQQRRISGVVSDANGDPVVGASVREKGTSNGTITDVNGKFSLNIQGDAVLQISYIGYVAQEVRTGSQSEVLVKLSEDNLALDEVVVVGYGTVRKSDLTGAVSSVKSTQFEEQRVTRLTDVLQGRASGMQISNTVGAPGGDVRIRIRGSNSILGDNTPLVVIDGFVGADFAMLNPNDIESVEILKDASSTAIYGSRGANGVILVTTKKGSKTGKVTINYQGDVSVASIIKPYDLLSAADYARTVVEKQKALGLTNYTFSESDISELEKNGGFDYMDAIFRNALSTQHGLAISGGTQKTQYRISGNYLSQEGIVVNSKLERYSVRVNLNTTVNDKLSLRFNLNGVSSSALNTQGRSQAYTPIVQALSWSPTVDPYDGKGGYTLSDPVGSIKPNPLAFAYDAESLNERTVANLMGGARYEIIDGLALDFQAGTDIFFGTGQSFSGNYVSNYHPGASISNNRSTNIQTTTQLSYDKTLADIHRINAVVAVETQKYTGKSSSSSASDLKFADLKYYNLGQAGSFGVGSGFSKSTLLSYLGRINYSLWDKYLFSISIRRDGSSKFAEGKKFSTFPSAAIAWNLKNESFMQEIDLFSKLKVRASWGLTGSQAIGSYATQSLYNGVTASLSPNSQTAGIQIGNPGNIDLMWETTEQKNIGLEAGFFNGRLNIELDYFAKNTKDLLLNKSVPMYIGGGSIVSNIGKIKNSGWELFINATPVSTSDIKWESQFNISKVKNQVVSLGQEERVFSSPTVSGVQGQPEFIYAVGQPLGSFWGLKYLGTWKKGQETEAARYNNVPGDARYEDVDKDGSITGDDYQIIGCGVPEISLGWNNTAHVKNFSFNLFFEGMLNFDKLNHTMAQNFLGLDTRYPTLAEIKERYIPGVNESAYYPAFSPTNVWETHSTMFLENASYLRLKNISVGYDFKIKNGAKLKVSLNALNLLTFTKYKGIDPESSNVGGGGSDINQSVDYGAYPNSKAYTIGIDITF